MLVHVAEQGERPEVLTKARQNAPAAMVAIAEILQHMDWAQDASLILDWQGDLSPSPEDKNPYLVITIRATPDNQSYCLVQSAIDVEDTFGKDTVDRNDLINVLNGLREELLRQFAAYREGNIRYGVVQYPNA